MDSFYHEKLFKGFMYSENYNLSVVYSMFWLFNKSRCSVLRLSLFYRVVPVKSYLPVNLPVNRWSSKIPPFTTLVLTKTGGRNRHLATLFLILHHVVFAFILFLLDLCADVPQLHALWTWVDAGTWNMVVQRNPLKGASIYDVRKSADFLTPPVRKFTQPPLLRLITMSAFEGTPLPPQCGCPQLRPPNINHLQNDSSHSISHRKGLFANWGLESWLQLVYSLSNLADDDELALVGLALLQADLVHGRLHPPVHADLLQAIV